MNYSWVTRWLPFSRGLLCPHQSLLTSSKNPLLLKISTSPHYFHASKKSAVEAENKSEWVSKRVKAEDMKNEEVIYMQTWSEVQQPSRAAEQYKNKCNLIKKTNYDKRGRIHWYKHVLYEHTCKWQRKNIHIEKINIKVQRNSLIMNHNEWLLRL